MQPASNLLYNRGTMRKAMTRTMLGAFAATVLAASAGVVVYTGRGPEPVPEAVEEVLPLPPESPRLVDDPDYLRCLEQMRDDAQAARSFAESWEASGHGGEGARHCLALSMLALGEQEQAAPRLETLAARSSAGAAARAAVYGQAAQAWIAAGQPMRAYGAVTLALALTPSDPDLLLDRAIAAGALGRFAESLADSSRSLEMDNARAEAWVFRAAALRHLDRGQEAMRDVEHALSLDPENPEALLERGILLQLNGDLEGARRDWERALQLAPDTATADLAQQNLALSEAGPTRR